MPQASAKQPPSGHPRICSQITGDSALQCWSGCEISPRVHHFYSRPCGRGDVAVTVAPADTVTFLLTPLREGRRLPCGQTRRPAYFYSRPCGRGDTPSLTSPSTVILFLLTPLREGRRKRPTQNPYPSRFLLTPLREGRHKTTFCLLVLSNFYSRPCGRGDGVVLFDCVRRIDDFYSRPCGRGDGRRPRRSSANTSISTHAPAGGATPRADGRAAVGGFLLTPLREGRRKEPKKPRPDLAISTHAPAGGATLRQSYIHARGDDFYSRPCGRGDGRSTESSRGSSTFLLTPLREGRRGRVRLTFLSRKNFYSRPCGRGDWRYVEEETWNDYFYSRPCGRGDPPQTSRRAAPAYFYSRPCGRGDPT